MRTLRLPWFSTIWLGLSLAIAGCGGGGGGGGASKEGPGPVDPKPLAELVSIEVTPTDRSLPKGVSQQYSATGVYSDSSTHDITAEVTWSSEDSQIASVDAAGLVTGDAVGGPVTISATLDEVTGSADVTISDALLSALDVTPPNASVPAGMTQKFVATGTYSDGSTLDVSDQVEWTSSDEEVATLDSTGMATALQANAGITVSAALDGFDDSASLTVTAATLQSIEVTAASYSVAAGYGQAYAATGRFSDGSTRNLTATVDWSSSDESVATVDAGKVTALKKGSAMVRAAFGDVSGTKGVSVTDAELLTISVSAPASNLAAGYAQQYSAQGHYSDGSTQDLTAQVAWSVSDHDLARVSNEAASKGRVTALAVGGPLDVIASSDAVDGSAPLTVTAAILTGIEVDAPGDSLAAGSTQQYSATGVYSNGSSLDLTQDVTWDATDDTVAEISNAEGSKGLATAMSAGGPIQISASYDPGSGVLSDSRPLTVTAASLVEIVVTADSEALFKGLEQQYTAIGLYSDNSESDLTDAVTWTVEPDELGTLVASISNADGSKGLLTALAEGGPAVVKATFGDAEGETFLTVGEATLVSLSLVPMAHQLPLGLTVQYQVTGTYSDDTELDLTRNVTWSSSDPSVASISNADGSEGLARGVSLGNPVTITATMANGPDPVSTTLTVTDAVLKSLVVAPGDFDLPRGVSQQYSATATFSDDSVQDVTQQVVWASSNEAVASISNTVGSQGLAKTLTSGTVTISATLEAFSATPATTTLTVNNLLLSALEIRPDETTCGRAQRMQFNAYVTYNDGTEQNLTSQVRWTSGDSRLFSIDPNSGLAKTTGNPNRFGSTLVMARLLGLDDEAIFTRVKSKTACTSP